MSVYAVSRFAAPFGAAALACIAGEAAADLRLDDPDAIVVTATRSVQPATEVGHAVDVIDRDDIVRLQLRNVADVLETSPGVSIGRNGANGGASGVFIRGAESDQTLVFVDGVKVNDPSAPGAGFDFGNLLTGQIDRIEVLRGAGAVAYGSQAIGGVVSIETMPVEDDPFIFANGEYGYADTRAASLGGGGRFGAIGLAGGVSWFDTDGISSFNETRGGTERDGYENLSASAKAEIELAPWLSADLRGFYVRGALDLDGFPPPNFSFADTQESSVSEQWLGYGALNLTTFEDALTHRVAYSRTETDRRNEDPNGFSPVTFEGEGETERFEYQGVYGDGGPLKIVFGYDREEVALRTSSFGAPFSEADTALNSGYLIAVSEIGPRATLTAGVRHDEHADFGGATTLAVSGVVTIAPGARLRASYSGGFKAPSLFQLFSDFGNPDLDAENSDSVDVGVEVNAVDETVKVTAGFFARSTRDQIGFVSCFQNDAPICNDAANPRPFGAYENIDRTRTYGFEAGVEARLAPSLLLSARYDYLHARNRSIGEANFDNPLARRPAHQATGSIDWTTPVGGSIGATAIYVGERFDDPGGFRPLDAYTIVNLRARYPVTSFLEVYGRVENVFDEEYENTFGFGTYPVSAFAGVRVSY